MVGFPNKPMGFPTKNDQNLGCLGVPPFKETPKNDAQSHRHLGLDFVEIPRKGDAFDARLSIHYGLPDTHCLHFGHVPGLPVGEKAWGLCISRMKKYIEWRSLTNQISLQIFSCVYTCIWIYRIWYIIFRFHVSCILTYFKIYKHPWNRLWGDYPFRRLNATVQQAHPLPPKSQPWAMFVSCS